MRHAHDCRFPPPPCTTGTRALRWWRRLLDRAHTVLRWHWRWRWRSVTPRITSATRDERHTHARTRHRRFPPPRRTTGTRALRWWRCLLDRAHAVWRWWWRWRSVTPRATHAARQTRARARHQSSSRKERARLNRRTKQLEFDLDIACRDEAAARADGAADRAKIASLCILKVTLPLARTHARTRTRRGAAPPLVHFVATSLSPSRTRGGARSLARSHARAVAASAVAARSVMAAAAATDDARGDGRGDYPPPAPPSGTGACQLRPPPQKHHRVAPSSSRFCPFSRPRSHKGALARQRHPHHPSVRPDDGALCARDYRTAEPEPE